MAPPRNDNSRDRLLAATIDLVRMNGYAATRVDDVCAEAGVTKGSFFHHFSSKEELAIAAAGRWDEQAARLFMNAPFRALTASRDRLLGYVAFRRGLVAGEIWEWTCYAGSTIQEVHATYPAIRDACAAAIDTHLRFLRGLIEDALRDHAVDGVSAETLATHMQAVLQGAFVMAKTSQDSQPALDSIDHLYRYLQLLFPAPAPESPRRKTPGNQNPHQKNG